MTTLEQYEPEEALAVAQGFLRAYYPKAKPEYVWSVVHHEYGTWLHLDVFDLNHNPQNPNIAHTGKRDRKYSRRERYRFVGRMHLPVRELGHGFHWSKGGDTLGRCKTCTQIWRDLNGYGSEDDIDAIDDLPGYKRKEQL